MSPSRAGASQNSESAGSGKKKKERRKKERKKDREGHAGGRGSKLRGEGKTSLT